VESNIETIKIFDKNDRLILSIVKEIDGAIEDEKAQILLNRADYLSSFAGTSIYKIEE
jgi:alpha-L-fucosidase